MVMNGPTGTADSVVVPDSTICAAVPETGDAPSVRQVGRDAAVRK
jgi:hypothetical protein